MKKKIFLLLGVIFFAGSTAFSQGITFGIKGGANLGKIEGKSFKDEFTLGYHVGAFATIGGKKLALQPEVLLSEINSDTSSRFSEIYNFNRIKNVKFQALTIPIMINYNISNILAIQAGPQFGIVLDKNKDMVQNGKDAFKSGYFAIAAGLQLNLMKFRVYGRYVGGLTDLKNIEASDTWKAKSIQLGIGLAF